MRWQKALMSVLILGLIQSCSNLESSPKVSSNTLVKTEGSKVIHMAPDIPFNKDQAFFPLRLNEDGKILPSYQWRVCTKRIIFCLKWEKKTVYFDDLSWFHANEYGLSKQRKP
jgi:hypothetical protein